MLHARMLAAGADRLVERVLVVDGAEQLAVARAEAGDGGLVEEQLGHRLKVDAVALLGGALGERVEGPHPVQFVAEEIEPQRLLGAGGEEIDDAAADGVLAGLAHGLGAGIAVVAQILLQPVHIQPLADRRLEGGGLEGGPRRHLLHHRRDGGQHDARPLGRLQQPAQGFDAPADQRRVGGNAVVGQAVPSREGQHLQRRGEEGDRFGQPGGAGIIKGDVQQPVLAGALGEVQQHANVVALGGAADQKAAGAARREIEFRHGRSRGTVCGAQFWEASVMRKLRSRAMTS